MSDLNCAGAVQNVAVDQNFGVGWIAVDGDHLIFGRENGATGQR